MRSPACERHAKRARIAWFCAIRTAAPCRTNWPRSSATFAPALPDALIGIHTHNDAECAVANALAAVAEGAMQVQGTVNGYGERCGNCNLMPVIASLRLKLGYDCLLPESLDISRRFRNMWTRSRT